MQSFKWISEVFICFAALCVGLSASMFKSSNEVKEHNTNSQLFIC
jgi:hypothetical protein